MCFQEESAGLHFAFSLFDAQRSDACGSKQSLLPPQHALGDDHALRKQGTVCLFFIQQLSKQIILGDQTTGAEEQQ
jgi:hypothetical protein